MAMTAPSWQALPHGPLEQLEDNLWTVEGSLPTSGPPTRRMTLARLETGGLLVFSAICLEPAGMAALEALGEPRVLVVPSGLHRLDAAAYRQRYPGLKVVCPAAARRRVAQAVAVDGDLEGVPASPHLRLLTVAGLRVGEALMVVRSASNRATVVFNDLIFNLHTAPGLRGWLLWAAGSLGGPKVTPLARWGMVRDRRAVAAQLRVLAQEPHLARILVSHGAPIVASPQGVLLQLAERL